MARETFTAREVGANPINARNGSRRRTKGVPAGQKLRYEDDLVTVYDDKGKVAYRGIHDYSPYKYDDWTWDDQAKNYKLPNGYRFVVK